jgi:ethanolamine ammonia-lyase small subunit
MSDMGLKRAAPDLRSLTAARVSLPMTGHSVAMSGALEFQLAHALARDAVHAALDSKDFSERLCGELPVLKELGLALLTLKTRAAERASYLRYPERGRSLDASSAEMLIASACDLSITIADGLSALAVERNAIPLLAALLPRVLEARWTLAPLTIVQQGRVAVGDAIGEGLGARCSLVLIGERPGLSAADSMGAYLTWAPRVGRTDAERNCLSNIRSGGLGVEAAAERLMDLMTAARGMGSTGVSLKEGIGISLPEI